MVREVAVRRVGGSLGATLPKELVTRLHVEAGDRLLAVETEAGILLTPYDPATSGRTAESSTWKPSLRPTASGWRAATRSRTATSTWRPSL